LASGDVKRGFTLHFVQHSSLMVCNSSKQVSEQQVVALTNKTKQKIGRPKKKTNLSKSTLRMRAYTMALNRGLFLCVVLVAAVGNIRSGYFQTSWHSLIDLAS
jgi:hypothetical protein